MCIKVGIFTALLSEVVILMFLGTVSVGAQGTPRSMTIIPPKYELFGNPGDQITETMRVRNDSTLPITLGVLVEDFSYTGEEGQVVLEEGQTDAKYSLAKWLEPETKDIILQPNEERQFSFTINIPRDAEPGGHYASVLFQAGGDSTAGAAAVAQRVGSLVLLRVSGSVVEKATIQTFEVPKYVKNSPVLFTLRMLNEGNTHIRPKGTIVITNMFGTKVDELPLNGLNVLPGATRKMDTEWKRTNLLGYYTATLVATYGQQNLPLTFAVKFFAASSTALVLMVVGAVAFVVFVISLISGRKRLMRALKVMVSGK